MHFLQKQLFDYLHTKKYLYENMFLRLASLLMGLTWGVKLPAQHNNWWTRWSVTYPVSAKFYTELESQLRLQTNQLDSHSSFFANRHLAHSIRFFAHFKISSKFSTSLSPFTWFATSPVILSPSDVEAPLQHEIRPSILAEWIPYSKGRLSLSLRTWLEYRYFQKTAEGLVRFRQRVGMRYQLHEKWYAFIGEEILLHLHGVSPLERFDHNRLVLNLNYKPQPNWRIEVGYIYIHRLLRNKMLYINENNIVTHFYYTFPLTKKQIMADI